ncbi:cytochrome c biogenesis protein ResB [Geomesophilobacter sediminis]|uniref:Cytochrome c biogenesis protein ResB n=1 Tax=Geomesophilobacter sediminis TaxID=2798584 RepID=A0A8J7S807_9BACT|nr:cytochrome c biogenesis protein ResB [Geomesophilobacter sediminis]MBJ6727282.1 cytochrome c biogenesis protein ResB [Geomesophilobacter sediminis]
MFKKIIKLLSSLKFTIFLIAVLGVIFAIGLWIPQARLVKDIYLQWYRNSPQLVEWLDFFGLTTIYTGPITVTIWILFFINLALVLWQRIPVVKHRIALSDDKITDPEKSPGYPFKRTFLLPQGMDGAAVLTQLGKRRYRVLGGPSGFYAVQNRLAPVAFMLFHVSFYLVLLGGLFSVYTEFIAYLDIAQGESFHGEVSRYNVKPAIKMPAIGSAPEASFTVKSIVPEVSGNTATGVNVELVDADRQSHLVHINTPYVTGPTSFVFKHLGMAPHFVLKDPSGKEVENALVKLDVLRMVPDKFDLGGYNFTATFYPDFVMVDGKRASRSREFKNPMFFLVAEKNGQKVGEALVPKDGVFQFAGNRLEMPELRYWVRFYVITQRGLPILYLGFAIACVAVIWRMVFYKRELVGKVAETPEGRALVIAGRSEYYKSLAEDEFVKLFSKITGVKLESDNEN